MRDGLETHKNNKRVRISKAGPLEFVVQVSVPNACEWIAVAKRHNIKEARIIMDCFAAIVEERI